MSEKITVVAINVIMLTQEKHVLLAMTHRSGSHSTTTMSAAAHHHHFHSYYRWMKEKGRHNIY